MRKTIKTLLIWVLFIGIVMGSPKVTNAAGDIKVLLEGQELKFDVPPQIIEGRTLLPLRAIFEALGLEVGWDDATRRITGIAEGKEIILKLDSKDAKVNGVDKILDVPAKAINGRTLVPVRFIAESLDMNVVWDQDSRTVKISKDDIIEWKYDGYEDTEPFKEYEKKYVNGIKTEETRYNGKKHLPFKFEIEKDDTISLFGARVTNLSDKKYLSINFVNYFYNKNSQNVEEDKVSLTGIGSKETKWESFYTYNYGQKYRNSEKYLYLGTIIESYKDYGDYSNRYTSTLYKNDNFEIEKSNMVSLQSINKVIDKYKNETEELEKKLSEERALNQGVPLKITNKSVTYNSIGIPEANISFKNLSNKTIDALELTIKCYDSYGRVVKELISNRDAFYAISQNRNIIPGSEEGGTWTLNLFENTTKIEVIVTSVHYTDGTSWKK